MTKRFIASADRPDKLPEQSWWFIFSKRKLLVTSNGQEPTIPLLSSPEDLDFQPMEDTYLGTLEGKHCYAAIVPDSDAAPLDMAFQDLFQLYRRLNQDMLLLSFRAIHLLEWSQQTRFCKRCGKEMKIQDGERAKKCPSCGQQSFPRISPAVIVLVERGDQCLLARSPRFQDGFYSVLAGFAEPGETLEETVKREVREETGIEVQDIRYFGSQPWPFPDSLMIGFTASYAGGEIRVDGTEILEANWFTFDQLPKIPGRISIARSLIEWFINKNKNTVEKSEGNITNSA
ncbi:MAG: NAD(+) diphosphatase [Thermodesulfobacteriota bacterium]|jgi:NAD+ diphosphatase